MVGIDAATLQAYAALGGLAVGLFGLAFVILQLRSLERSIKTGAHAAIYERAADFRAHLVAHPHLRRYFFEGAPLADNDPDYERATIIAELQLNHLEHIVVTMESFGTENRVALEAHIRDALARGPVLGKILRDRPEAYSPALRRYLGASAARP